MGFELERFEDPDTVDNELICTICGGVFIDPVVVSSRFQYIVIDEAKIFVGTNVVFRTETIVADLLKNSPHLHLLYVSF